MAIFGRSSVVVRGTIAILEKNGGLKTPVKTSGKFLGI